MTDEPRLTSLLPGPVAVRPQVAAALARPAVSHRSAGFQLVLDGIRDHLRVLTGARHVQLLLGSGTLANDAVAGQLSLLGEPGLILVNGEFGRRLVDHARRFRLAFEVLGVPWGEALDFEPVRRRLACEPRLGWLWAVHHETSTGVLNDLPGLSELCAEAGVRLCVDAISSLGTAPVDLSRVFLAAGVGGKGLGSYPGLSLVFHPHEIPARPEVLPRYLDLGLYAAGSGVPFTHSSNLLAALAAALDRPSWPERFREIREMGTWLRAELRRAGFGVLAPEAVAAPAVVTVVLPPHLDSRQLGEALERSGFLLSWASDYLLGRNWVQICLMGEVAHDDLARAVEAMARLSSRPARLGP